MTAFSAAIDAIFADPNMAADALWISRGVAAPVACRLIRKAPDTLSAYGDARLLSDSLLADVRMTDISTPESGDRINIGTDRFVIQGDPVGDRDQLIWTLELVPA